MSFDQAAADDANPLADPEERPARREEIVSFGAFHEKPGAPGANQLDAAAYVRRDYGNAARHGFENDVR